MSPYILALFSFLHCSSVLIYYIYMSPSDVSLYSFLCSLNGISAQINLTLIPTIWLSLLSLLSQIHMDSSLFSSLLCPPLPLFFPFPLKSHSTKMTVVVPQVSPNIFIQNSNSILYPLFQFWTRPDPFWEVWGALIADAYFLPSGHRWCPLFSHTGLIHPIPHWRVLGHCNPLSLMKSTQIPL